MLLGGVFLLGAVFGCVAAGCVEGESGAALEEYLREYLALVREGSGALSVSAVIWERFRFPLCILLLSFTAFGVLCIPVVLMLRGFLFSFSVACFFRLFGWKGLLLGAALFGLSALLWVPALFALSVLGVEQSYRMFQRCAGKKGEQLLSPSGGSVSWGMCLMVLGLSVAVEYFAVPRLMAVLAGVVL